MMVNLRSIFVRILFISCCFLTVHCSQPNCTSVSDFKDCEGNVTNFCPENIICACKDGIPFCKCPNFRGRWGNYWYMGAKCEQLWSTLDLILVAALPGLGLALIFGLTIQIVYCYKKNLKKNRNDYRQQSFSGIQSHHNTTSPYAFDTTAVGSQTDQSQVQNHFISPPQSILPRIPVSLPPHFSEKSDNFMIHKNKEDNSHIYPNYDGDNSLGIALPEEDYESKYSSSMHMQPHSSSSISPMSRSSYIQRQQFERPSFEKQEIPLKIGRVQIKPNY